MSKAGKVLTLEALQQMDGQPVWVENIQVGKAFWMLAYKDRVCNRLGYLRYSDYGKVWVAYDRKYKDGLGFCKIDAASSDSTAHSAWEFIGEEYAGCMNCGCIFEALPTPFAFKANNKYCRNCGARMDLEVQVCD